MIWSLTSLRANRVSGSENFRSSFQKDFCNNICQEETRRGWMSRAENSYIPSVPCMEEGGMQIRVDDLRGLEIAELLRAHLENCRKWSPPESVHALDLNALRSPDVTFWTAWDGASLLGCGALKELDSIQGEIKSMHTAAKHRGRGVAAGLVTVMVAEARTRSYQRLSLETGSMDAFAPARALYSRFGFICSGPFGEYILDPNSVFMTLDLANKHIGRSQPK
jgi:putative acetyltransferase